MSKQIMKSILFTLCLMIMFSGSWFRAEAGSPMEKVRQATEDITLILDDYVKNPEGRKDECISKVMAIADVYFDWTEMSRRTLARYWKARTPEEQKEFSGLFRDLLKNAYIGRIESYSGEKVIFEGETTDDKYAVVKSQIITPKQKTEVPVNYRLIKKENGWMVYDVVIEGVSLVNNYRSQFNSILQSSSYEELVKRIKDKIAEENNK